MNNKKVLSLAIAVFTLCGSTTLFSNTAKAETGTTTTNKVIESTIVAPRQAGIVIVTAVSGAYLRSNAGTTYSKVSTANYGEELAWNGSNKKDASGVTWYYVTKMINGQLTNVKGYISSSVSTLS